MTAFEFTKPKFIELLFPGQDFPIPVDLFECWRTVVEADAMPDQKNRWNHINVFLITKLGFTEEQFKEAQIWEGTAREFRTLVIQEMDKYQDEVKKKLGSTASSQPTTQD